METIVKDLYWLMTTYNNTRYFLIRDDNTHEWRLGNTNNYSTRDRCYNEDLIHNALSDYEAKKVLEEIAGKKFKVWVYKETDYHQDDIYKQVSFVPEFKKVPVEVTLKYFGLYGC